MKERKKRRIKKDHSGGMMQKKRGECITCTHNVQSDETDTDTVYKLSLNMITRREELTHICITPEC